MAGLFVLACLLGVIPAWIAQRKGHSFLGWWLFGTLLFVIALPCALMEKPNPAKFRQCPWCAERMVPREASVCARCQRALPPAPPPPPPGSPLGLPEGVRVWDVPRDR